MKATSFVRQKLLICYFCLPSCKNKYEQSSLLASYMLISHYPVKPEGIPFHEDRKTSDSLALPQPIASKIKEFFSVIHFVFSTGFNCLNWKITRERRR